MADYENGLPPESANLENKNINNVIIGRSNLNATDTAENINAFLISKSDFTPTDTPNNAKYIIVTKETTGNNTSMFL